jgi:hypothetical protein
MRRATVTAAFGVAPAEGENLHQRSQSWGRPTPAIQSITSASGRDSLRTTVALNLQCLARMFLPIRGYNSALVTF